MCSSSHHHLMASNKSSMSSRTCLCAPTTHPGSFRCSLHRSRRPPLVRSAVYSGSTNRVESRGGGGSDKGRSMRAILTQMIKPSSHDLCRRRNFEPKPSRFCLINGSGQSVSVV